jgi:hypothetical protein
MRGVIALVIGTFLVAGMQPLDGAPLVNPQARVRAIQKEVAGLLSDGMSHSPTFRRLVNRLEQSHLIVYIDLRPDMPSSIGGSLRFLAESATDRFLRVQLNRTMSRRWIVALLGHELQHAVEVADAPDIHSAEDLRLLYRQIGVRTGPDTYDSAAARQAGLTIRDELENAHGSLRFAKSPRADEPPPEGESLGADGSLSSASAPLDPAMERPVRAHN